MTDIGAEIKRGLERNPRGAGPPLACRATDMTHILTVDLSNKTATITDHTGRWIRAWSNVTRTSAYYMAQLDGWTATSYWELTSPPDGFYRHVTPDPTSHRKEAHTPCPHDHAARTFPVTAKSTSPEQDEVNGPVDATRTPTTRRGK